MSILYYRLDLIRCAELDIIFGAVIAMCIYFVLEPMIKPKSQPPKAEQVSENESSVSEEKHERRVYTVDFIRSIKETNVIPDFEYSYKISARPVEVRQSYSPVPRSHRSPDPFNYFNSHTPEPAGFVSRSPRNRLDPEEERDMNNTIRMLTPDFIDEDVDLPTELQVGRVHYLRKNNGRIHVINAIHGVKDIFFHVKDWILEAGDSVQLGDSVTFEVSLFENRLCASKVKKIPKIESPDFSRRAMKQSKEKQLEVDDLVL